jgi:RecA/RadA recombinase
MSKPTAQSIADEIRALYAKDKTMTRILDVSAEGPKNYGEADGLSIPERSPLRDLTGLPCLPFNKIIQVAGEPDTGKSTMVAEPMALAQKAGWEVILWDAEDKFDAFRYQSEFGGDPTKLNYIRTNETRKGGQLVKDYITTIRKHRKDAKILVVWDSVGASMSRAETERNLADEKHGQPGQDAKENGAVVRHLVGMFNSFPDCVSVLLVNQTYDKIGFMQKGKKAKGGSGIEFHSSLIIWLRRIKVVTKMEQGKKVKTGIITRATVAKNHLTQGRTSVYQMDFLITAAGFQKSGAQSKEEDLDVEDREEGDESAED